MLYYKTLEEVELIRKSSLLVGNTLAEVAKMIRPGVTTLSLDERAEQFILDHGAKPGFKGYNKYPYTLCISINKEVVHGMPGKREIVNGDIVSIDCGVIMNGFYGDSAYTFAVGEVKEEYLRLLRVTKECLYKGIENAIAGQRVGDISFSVQQHAENHHYSVVRELVGHGVGRQLHEKPEVPNYGQRGAGMMLKEGLVIAIEPMINFGKHTVSQASDGWTVYAKDGLPSAHFEHTVAVKKDKADILSSFSEIEAVENQNLIKI